MLYLKKNHSHNSSESVTWENEQKYLKVKHYKINTTTLHNCKKQNQDK